MERKVHFKENLLIFWGIWGEAKLFFRIWGAKEKYFQGAEEFSFRDFGRSMHYFQGSREHRPPPPPPGGLLPVPTLASVGERTSLSLSKRFINRINEVYVVFFLSKTLTSFI